MGSFGPPPSCSNNLQQNETHIVHRHCGCKCEAISRKDGSFVADFSRLKDHVTRLRAIAAVSHLCKVVAAATAAVLRTGNSTVVQQPALSLQRGQRPHLPATN